jgi:transcriptional regulator of acetoin/glycerol metabolism
VAIAEPPRRAGADPRSVDRAVARAHKRFLGGVDAAGMRPVVLDSWRRSMRWGVDPDGKLPPIELLDAEPEEYRAAHPLAAAAAGSVARRGAGGG